MAYYVNYRVFSAETNNERRQFIGNWWRIYRWDPAWTPPYYPALKQALNPAANPHLARLQPTCAWVEALPRRYNPNLLQAYQPMIDPTAMETPLAATALLHDARRGDKTAYLALLHSSPDTEGLTWLLDHATEAARSRGYRRLLGPTGLSPHLGSGCLLDYWNQPVPLHTPYNPPYLPEMLAATSEPLAPRRLYHLPVPADLPPTLPGPAELLPLEPARLAADLRPLLAAACAHEAGFALPDAAEAAFLLRWLSTGSLTGWLAQVSPRGGDEPVGFVLLAPDTAARLRWLRGGRPLWGRLWLAALRGRPVRQGRVLFGAVLPAWRGQGIGRQLARQALATAQAQGWQTLTVGPLSEASPAVALLRPYHAEPRQTYQLYEWLL